MVRIFCLFAVVAMLASGVSGAAELSVGVFDVDVTPPIGSQMAYDPVINTWDLGLRAKGIVLQGAGDPIVLCSIDWIGIGNEGHAESGGIYHPEGSGPFRIPGRGHQNPGDY